MIAADLGTTVALAEHMVVTAVTAGRISAVVDCSSGFVRFSDDDSASLGGLAALKDKMDRVAQMSAELHQAHLQMSTSKPYLHRLMTNVLGGGSDGKHKSALPNDEMAEFGTDFNAPNY